MNASKQQLLLSVYAGLVWTAANAGYYYIPTLLGYHITYNTTPLITSVYFGVWVLIAGLLFRNILAQLTIERQLSVYLLVLTLYGVCFSVLFYYFSLLPIPHTPFALPESDILTATPWYFAPKAIEVLLQQILVVVAIVGLYNYFGTVRATAIAFAILFPLAHILFDTTIGTTVPFMIIMSFGALVSALFFPYFIIRVRSGFVYTYLIHLAFYLVVATLLHFFL